MTRCAFVGIGNRLRGDDAAGPLVIDRLRAALLDGERFLLLDAGSAPENITGVLRRFAPDFVLLVDAADLGLAPGSWQLLDPAVCTGLGSGHTMPLSALARYLRMELGCSVRLLGIQPDSTVFGEAVSTEVEQAVGDIGRWLAELACSDLGVLQRSLVHHAHNP
ncbi:MAG: hydrogenase 3 maturation endopeptidase HyCI [Chloroflexi bacterium]|nr:hydrogenase 3 maturation endopeptidase HyCI [Chloroflexota bacterium]